MIKKISVLTGLILFSFLTIFAVNKFYNMNWENSVISKIKNIPSASENNTSEDLPEMKAPRIVVRKKARTLEVFDGGKLIKKYKIALGFEPVGDKEVEGDGKTPEGEFYIFTKNPKSQFYLSLGVSYPDIEDAKRGLENELITPEEHDAILKAINAKKIPPQKTKLGGEIYIHGHGNSYDWTAGCVAMTDEDIKELFDAIPVKTPVRIEP